MAYQPPVPGVCCPWCGHAHGGRDTFTREGVFIPQHKCAFRDCGKWYAVAYRVTVEQVEGEGGATDIVVHARVEGVAKSYGASLPHLLDTLTSLQRLPGVSLSNHEVRVAFACASALSESAA
jgi:hypothetical protein